MREILINWSKIISYKEISQADIPGSSGVYELLVKNKAGKWTRKYVGSSDNLSRRLEEHMSQNEENEKIKNGLKKLFWGFDFAVIDDEDDYLDAEQGLYDKHDYDWNEKRPDGSGYSYRITEK